LNQTLTPQEEQPKPTPWYVVGGVVLVLALTRLLFGAFAAERSPAKPKPLAAELPSLRLTEGRLSGQTAYAPYPTFPDKRHRPLLAEFRGVSGSLRDRAFYHLLVNQLDRAVTDMEEAVRTTPGEASLLSDLSAFYCERARAKNRPEDYVAALEMAERAAAVSPNSAEAAFNRALALEHLFLIDKAHDAWWRYQVLDRSPWSAEALKHAQKLIVENRQFAEQRQPNLLQLIAKGDEKGIVRFTERNPQEAREVLETTLLWKWAEATARGQEDRALLRLMGARRIVQALAGRGGNRIFLGIVAEMERIAAYPAGSRQMATLVQALRLYRIGRDELSIGGCAAAMRDFGAAEVDLHSIGSAAELIVSSQKFYCEICQHDFPTAHATLARLGQDSRITDYPSLEAWRQMKLAYLARRVEDLDSALGASRHALALFRALGEPSNVAEMQSQIAEILESLGQSAEAWRYRYSALAWTRRLPANKYQLPTGNRKQFSIALDIFEEAVQASLSQRRPEAALQLQNRAVSLAQSLEEPESVALALLTRARIEVVLGRQETAKRDFKGALNNLPSVRNWASELLAARIDIVRNEIADAESRAAAISISSERFVPEHLGRADFDFRRGDTAAGEKSLERALDELEHRREKVAPGSYRISFFDQARPLYERLVALEVHLAQPEKALSALERFRARSLLDQLGKTPGSGVGAVPLDWRDLLRRIPEHTVLSVYAVVEGRLVTWLVKPSGVWIASNQPDWPTISSWAQRLRDPEAGDTERTELLKRLYDELVAPWKTRLGDGDRIIFVPTADLYRVPYAALLDRASGRFLIEDHAVGVAPSASEFVAALERDRRAWVRPIAHVLLVGNPEYHDAGRLPSLPGSAREVESLSRIYRERAEVLTQKQATPSRVLASLSAADVVHMAVHGINDFEDPMRSRLMLSPSGAESGELSARDLLRVHLARTRLVVLAACGSQTGPMSESEGSLSLAYSFLAAGVPAVVGSLWLVDDESTARLSIRFHQELLRGVDALTALQAAQRDELAAHRSASDWTWASFQVYGGVEERIP
jgi:CHAT domain-containing protein/tetratricopeptide (TPR) repeat protein